MTVHFTEIPTVPALGGLFEASRQSPIVLYLHDPSCGLSSLAHRQVAQLEGEVALIDVHSHHHLSMEVERMTGVRHESPQVIILKDERPVWSASHRSVTADAIRRALAGLDGQPQTAPGGEPARLDGPPAGGWLRRLLR